MLGNMLNDLAEAIRRWTEKKNDNNCLSHCCVSRTPVFREQKQKLCFTRLQCFTSLSFRFKFVWNKTCKTHTPKKPVLHTSHVPLLNWREASVPSGGPVEPVLLRSKPSLQMPLRCCSLSTWLLSRNSTTSSMSLPWEYRLIRRCVLRTCRKFWPLTNRFGLLSHQLWEITVGLWVTPCQRSHIARICKQLCNLDLELFMHRSSLSLYLFILVSCIVWTVLSCFPCAMILDPKERLTWHSIFVELFFVLQFPSWLLSGTLCDEMTHPKHMLPVPSMCAIARSRIFAVWFHPELAMW